MLILVTGASGFLGQAVARELAGAGHELVCAVRRPPAVGAADPSPNRSRFIATDFTRDLTPGDWLPRLAGVDVVVNTVGILREDRTQTFDALHARAPRALFAACAEAGVPRVVQVSALGADAEAQSAYHLSKKGADDFLLQLPLSAVVVQPSLVYGAQGTSARMFRSMASLPLIPVPGSGRQTIQPIHVDDFAAAVAALAIHDQRTGRVALVGPAPISMQEYLATLRRAMGLGRARFIRIPERLITAMARAGGAQMGLPDADTLAMLARGNTADVQATRELLGRAPRPASAFIPADDARSQAVMAKLGWLAPVLRASIAIVWIVTGVVSFGIYPVEESYRLLGQVGVAGWMAPVLLYGAATMDVALGIATLTCRRRWLWKLQVAVIAGYTLIISLKLPGFWLHPYGPILKNLPLLAAIWLLHELDER